MKIIYLLDNFPPDSWTSAGILTFNLAKKMTGRGHRVFIITTVQKKELAGQSNHDGLEIYKIYTKYPLGWRAYISLYNYQAIKQIKKILEEIKPDVCHFHHVHQYISYYSFKLAKKIKAKVFLTAHDVMLFHYGKMFEFINQNHPDLSEFNSQKINYHIDWRQLLKRFKKKYNPLRNIIIRHYLKYVDKIFAVSNALKETLNQNHIPNVAVIHNGLNLEDWQSDEQNLKKILEKYNLAGKKIVFYSGRLSALKGGKKIIEAMELVIKKIPEAILLVCGEKDAYAEQMLKLATDKKISIVFTGWVTGTERIMAYYSANIVSLPSIYLDPLPTITLEAMACAKPVIGTCYGGTPEIIIDNQTGYVINPHNTQMLAEKIIDLLKNPQKAQQFGAAGRQRIKEKFLLDKQMEETLAWYQKIFND